ncbi:MAG: DNA-directed RNA polymerase subunit delta [Bacilli bacterium]|nr:DNA-directed RNA polymerase subunit delta [Bacilli bacterium]
MKKLTLTEEQLESMSYGDVAQYILENNTKPISLQDLFKEVIRLMGLPESDFETHIFDFFTLLSNDKNFIMLDKGMWDLTVRHQNKISISKDTESDDEEVEENLDEEIEEDDSEVNYDDSSLDDDQVEDDFKDLVIINDDELDQES